MFTDTRDAIEGWTKGSVRRHVRKLYSVQVDQLTGTGWAFTLTLRENPATSEEWKAIVVALRHRLARMGSLRLHWLVELQRRKVVHLHGVVYFPTEDRSDGPRILRHWLDLVGERWGANPSAQTVERVEGVTGWLAYISKHSARGVNHYQRQGRPDGWTGMGRLWAFSGSWPFAEPIRFVVTREGFFWLRRRARSFALSEARTRLAVARRRRNPDAAKAARRSIRSLRQQLDVGTREKSEVRGVSEWVPEGVTLTLLLHLVDLGMARLQDAADFGVPPTLAAHVIAPVV